MSTILVFAILLIVLSLCALVLIVKPLLSKKSLQKRPKKEKEPKFKELMDLQFALHRKQNHTEIEREFYCAMVRGEFWRAARAHMAIKKSEERVWF